MCHRKRNPFARLGQSVQAVRVLTWFAPPGLRVAAPVDRWLRPPRPQVQRRLGAVGAPGPAAAAAAAAAGAAASGAVGAAASSAPHATANIDISKRTEPNDSHTDLNFIARCSLNCESSIRTIGPESPRNHRGYVAFFGRGAYPVQSRPRSQPRRREAFARARRCTFSTPFPMCQGIGIRVIAAYYAQDETGVSFRRRN